LPRDQQKALDALKKQWKKDSGDEAAPRAPDYHHHFLKPNASDPKFRHDDSFELDVLERFQGDDPPEDISRLLLVKSEGAEGQEPHWVKDYYHPIRAGAECLACHASAAERPARNGERGEDHAAPRAARAELKENGLIAVIKIRMPTDTIETGMHRNRAVL